MGIAQIMAEVGAKVSYLQKQGSNSAQNYKYARSQDVFLAVNKELSERGVACVNSTAELLESVDGLGKSGNQHRAVIRITQMYKDDKSGETAQFQGIGAGCDSQDKAVMKANTAALKYLLTDAFNISWGDDPEAVDPETGESTGGKAAPKRAAKPKKPSSAKEQAALLKAIAAATTTEELDICKKQVLALDNQTPEYTAARDAVVARREALKAAA